MPNIRVMVWNIEQFSDVKIVIPGMMTAIANTIAAANVDVVVVVEVRKTNVATIGTTMSNALRAADGGGNNWRGYILSEETGMEYYGVWIRNMNLIRPMTLDPTYANGNAGTADDPLSDLFQNRWRIWPTPNWATNAYPLPAALPKFPLVDLFAAPARALRRQRINFGGQAIARGGMSLGRGYRMPSMPMLWIHTGASDTVIPIVVCHYAAVRGGRNILGQSQVNQLKDLHLPQLFRDDNGNSGWLQYRNAAGNTAFFNVQEILFTGDFNLDFLQNLAGPGTSNIQRTNRKAYNALTPATEDGGSAAPNANPGAPVAMPGAQYAPPYPAPAMTTDIDNQSLRAAVTTQGTIMLYPPLAAPPAPTAPPSPYSSAAFDNFIYGGTRLNTAVVNFGVNGWDSGNSLHVPTSIIQTGAAGPGINLSAVAGYYAPTNRKSAGTAPSLQGASGVAPALTQNDRLVGARLVSDHLPVVIQFAVP